MIHFRINDIFCMDLENVFNLQMEAKSAKSLKNCHISIGVCATYLMFCLFNVSISFLFTFSPVIFIMILWTSILYVEISRNKGYGGDFVVKQKR